MSRAEYERECALAREEWERCWRWLEPAARVEAIWCHVAGCKLPLWQARLAWLVGGGVDDYDLAWNGAMWSTNCGESMWGVIQHACGGPEAARAVYGPLADVSRIGSSLSLVVGLMQAKGMTRLRDSLGRITGQPAPSEPSICWWASRPQRTDAAGNLVHDDHVGQVVEMTSGDPWLAQGGASQNRISISQQGPMWSAGRPLVGYTPIRLLGLPPAYQGEQAA